MIRTSYSYFYCTSKIWLFGIVGILYVEMLNAMVRCCWLPAAPASGASLLLPLYFCRHLVPAGAFCEDKKLNHWGIFHILHMNDERKEDLLFTIKAKVTGTL